MKITKRQIIRSITIIGGVAMALTCALDYGAEYERIAIAKYLNSMELYDKNGKLLKF